MTESVEYRFGPAARSLPHPIEWPTDNVLRQESMEASE